MISLEIVVENGLITVRVFLGMHSGVISVKSMVCVVHLGVIYEGQNLCMLML
jgi:hypothetical protein